MSENEKTTTTDLQHPATMCIGKWACVQGIMFRDTCLEKRFSLLVEVGNANHSIYTRKNNKVSSLAEHVAEVLIP